MRYKHSKMNILSHRFGFVTLWPLCFVTSSKWMEKMPISTSHLQLIINQSSASRPIQQALRVRVPSRRGGMEMLPPPALPPPSYWPPDTCSVSRQNPSKTRIKLLAHDLVGEMSGIVTTALAVKQPLNGIEQGLFSHKTTVAASGWSSWTDQFSKLL